MAEYTWRQWENEQNDSNLLHAADCERWQAGIELAGGTWDGSWTDLDTSGKGLITIDQFNSLESQIQSKVSSYTPKNYDPDSTVQIVPGPDGWNKVENGIITAICKPDGVNVNIMSGTDELEIPTYSAYGATATYEHGVVVSEWGAENAVHASGQTQPDASSRICLIYQPLQHGSIVTDQSYAVSFYIRNDGDNDITLVFNGFNGSNITVQPGESTKIETVMQYMSGSPQIQFRVNTAGDTMEVTYWHMKWEYGEEFTDWVPCPKDFGYPSVDL